MNIKGMKWGKMGLMAAVCVAAMGMLASCSGKARLAKEIAGTWSANPERIADGTSAMASLTRSMEFTPSVADQSEGMVVMSVAVTVENTTGPTDEITTPLEVSATGRATIQGAYQVKDEDEIIVVLDGSTMQVEVDPEAVVLNYNVLSETSSPNVEALKPAAVELVRRQVRHAASEAFASTGKIDDIHIKGNIMNCEIADRHLSFAR